MGIGGSVVSVVSVVRVVFVLFLHIPPLLSESCFFCVWRGFRQKQNRVRRQGQRLVLNRVRKQI